MEQVLTARAQGQSVRSCLQSLAGGDHSLMLRYQNKYRAVLKSRPEYVQKLVEALNARGVPCETPQVNHRVRPDVAAACQTLTDEGRRSGDAELARACETLAKHLLGRRRGARGAVRGGAGAGGRGQGVPRRRAGGARARSAGLLRAHRRAHRGIGGAFAGGVTEAARARGPGGAKGREQGAGLSPRPTRSRAGARRGRRATAAALLPGRVRAGKRARASFGSRTGREAVAALLSGRARAGRRSRQ